jgi:hypothetical protein
MKVAELEGRALDEWVARALGYKSGNDVPSTLTGEWSDGSGTKNDWTPSTDWAQAGPIIERERIQTVPQNVNHLRWSAYIDEGLRPGQYAIEEFGTTLLEAAMRAYVAKVFGEEVQDAPSESMG